MSFRPFYDATGSQIPHQPYSPSLSTVSHDDNENIPWGFGFEFESCLEAKWQDDLERQKARLGRYARFGMQIDEARQPTPEEMRDKYSRFIESELEDVHTPTPPSSPESMPRPPHPQGVKRDPRNLRSARTKRNNRKKSERQIGVEPAGIKNRRKKDYTLLIQSPLSLHHMVTRSRQATKWQII
jgi:hypothetical protein